MPHHMPWGTAPPTKALTGADGDKSRDRIPGPESKSQDVSSWAQQGLKHGGERAKAGLKH